MCTPNLSYIFWPITFQIAYCVVATYWIIKWFNIKKDPGIFVFILLFLLLIIFSYVILLGFWWLSKELWPVIWYPEYFACISPTRLFYYNSRNLSYYNSTNLFFYIESVIFSCYWIFRLQKKYQGKFREILSMRSHPFLYSLFILLLLSGYSLIRLFLWK